MHSRANIEKNRAENAMQRPVIIRVECAALGLDERMDDELVLLAVIAQKFTHIKRIAIER